MVERLGVSHTVVREATKAVSIFSGSSMPHHRGMIVDRVQFSAHQRIFTSAFISPCAIIPRTNCSRFAAGRSSLAFAALHDEGPEEGIRCCTAGFWTWPNRGPNSRTLPTIAGSPTTSLFIGGQLRGKRAAAVGGDLRSAASVLSQIPRIHDRRYQRQTVSLSNRRDPSQRRLGFGRQHVAASHERLREVRRRVGTARPGSEAFLGSLMKRGVTFGELLLSLG